MRKLLTILALACGLAFFACAGDDDYSEQDRETDRENIRYLYSCVALLSVSYAAGKLRRRLV